MIMLDKRTLYGAAILSHLYEVNLAGNPRIGVLYQSRPYHWCRSVGISQRLTHPVHNTGLNAVLEPVAEVIRDEANRL